MFQIYQYVKIYALHLMYTKMWLDIQAKTIMKNSLSTDKVTFQTDQSENPTYAYVITETMLDKHYIKQFVLNITKNKNYSMVQLS